MVLVNQFRRALPTKRRTAGFVTRSAVTATMVLALSVGSTAPQSSVTTVPSATSPNRTEEELVRLTSVITARSGASYGTLSAAIASTMSVAVSAHPIALVA